MKLRCPGCEVIIRMKEESRPAPGRKVAVTCPRCGTRSLFTQPTDAELVMGDRNIYVAEKLYEYSTKHGEVN